jgi:hypothetical protein
MNEFSCCGSEFFNAAAAASAHRLLAPGAESSRQPDTEPDAGHQADQSADRSNGEEGDHRALAFEVLEAECTSEGTCRGGCDDPAEEQTRNSSEDSDNVFHAVLDLELPAMAKG